MIPNGTKHNELRQLVRSQLELLLESGNLEGAKSLLIPVQPVDIAEAIEGLPESNQLIAFRLLSKAEAIEVYEYLNTGKATEDTASSFYTNPAKVVRRLLSQLSPKERQATAILLGYGEDTAGRIMTPEYISLKENLTVSQTLERIRNLANASEVVYYLYVTDISQLWQKL